MATNVRTIILELPMLRDAILSGKAEDPLVQWMLFVDGESQEVIKMLAQDNKDIRQAYTLLEVISQDKIKRMAYEARQAEIMDQRSRMIFAERKGIRKVNRIFHPPPDLISLP